MRGFTQTLQWAAALIVVRLLTPEDYGLVGMATAYLGLARVVSEFGLSAAIIQHRDLSEDQIGRVYSVSVAFALFFALVSVGAAGPLAGFFNEPKVEAIVLVMSLTFVFGGLDIVPRSLLKRDLRFRRLAWIQASESTTYAAVSLLLAALGFGYWALVWGGVAGVFVRMVGALGSRFHRFVLPRRGLESIMDELWFGWHVIGARLAIQIRQFLDTAIVAKILGTAALGAYNVAWTQATIPVDRVTMLVGEVMPSFFAAVKNDLPAFRRYVRLITEAVALVSFPATVGLALVADDFVMLVFGDRWAPAIAPLQILALVGALRSITPMLSQVLVGTEQPKKNMQFTVLSAVVIPICLLIGTNWGLRGVAIGWLVGHPIVMIPILMPHALRAIEMSFGEYLRALRAPALGCAAMVIAVLVTREVMPADLSLAIRLAVEVSVGALVYSGVLFSTYRDRAIMLLRLLRSARKEGAVNVVAEESFSEVHS